VRFLAMLRQPDLVELVRHHQAGLWRYLRFLGCESALAEDLVQDTFLALIEHEMVELAPAATAAYLRRIAHNLYRKAQRARRRERELIGFDEAETTWKRWCGDGDGEAWLDALRGCLERLGERARRALDLRYAEGASRASSADALGLSEDGVKTLLARTRDALRECIERQVKR
jgi:RNA polymerase sigma-70 factor (ECF subfamily)